MSRAANPSQRTAPIRDALRRAVRAIARVPEFAARGLVLAYRYTLSGVIGPRCRHLPTCSEYAGEAFQRFGFWAGGWMTLARICRCHPWGTSGLDFVCEALPAESRWYMPWRYGRWRGTDCGPAGHDRADAANPARDRF